MVGWRRVGENGLICPQESPGSVNNEIEGRSSRSGPVRSLATFAPVPGSPTPRELAVADGSVRSYRIGPWSSWGIRCKNRPARRQSGKAVRGVCSLTAETNPLALRVVHVLRNSQVIMAGGSLTVRSAARFTPNGSNSTRFRPSGRQKSAKQSQLNSATKHSPSKS